MPAKKKTAFDRFVGEKMKNSEFAAGYRQAKREIDAVDRIVRSLDKARIDLGMSKAELARRISAKPEIVRRLLTEEHANPTMATIVKVAGAVGLRVELVSAQPQRTQGAARRTAGSAHTGA